MSRQEWLRHVFVEFIPDTIEDGVLYVSYEYATAVHRCCCGCGSEVVTPISPTDWSLTFNGDSVALSPSIGNWSFPCRSHYWIEFGRVKWAGQWSQEKIAAGRLNDALAKERRFAPDPLEQAVVEILEENPDQTPAEIPEPESWLAWIVHRVRAKVAVLRRASRRRWKGTSSRDHGSGT